MVNLIDPPPTPPDWLSSTLITQFFFSFSLGVAGFCHLAAHGVLSKLYTGIYVGLITALATYSQKWILAKTTSTGVLYTRNQLRGCQIISAVALLLCAINIPIVSLFSVAYGDAFGRPFNEELPYCFFCWEPHQMGANVPALICDGGLILFGMITSLLLCASGSYFWTLIATDRIWCIDKIRYTPAKQRV